MGLGDLLHGCIARERVGIRFLERERFASKYGYKFKREHSNIYGRLQLVPVATTDSGTAPGDP